MKILHVNTNDISGGAARAASRLQQGLHQIGVDSNMLVQNKEGDDNYIFGPASKSGKLYSKAKPFIDLLPLVFYRYKEKVPYSIQWLPNNLQSRLNSFNPGIVHLHWICGGFLSIQYLAKINVPLVWTLHDMWAFTGGCHYAGECERYKNKCGHCPKLGSQHERDISRWVWKQKNKAWKNLYLTVVTPSKWLAECAKKSSLFQNMHVEVIPNGLDLQRYHPMDHILVRNILNLPRDKKLIIFGAMGSTSDVRKGFQYLKPALQKLEGSYLMEQAEIIVFGSSEPEDSSDFGIKTHYFGHLYDDVSLALLYAASDVMIVPSIQEAFGQTASEAMACGTPVVAFDVTGLKDIVDHKENGYLARPFDPKDLARGITWVLENQSRHHELCQNARKKVECEFGLKKVAGEYKELYEDILSKKGTPIE